MKPCTSPRYLSIAVAIATLAIGSAAHADDDTWWAHAGVASVMFHDSTTLFAGGNVVPGAGAKSSDNTALVFELGHQWTPQWSASLTFGVPPTTTVTGTGTAAALGKVGEITYGPLVFAGQYRWGDPGSIRPYLGAGAVYYIVLASKDAAIEQLDVKNGWGSALQAGVEVPLAKGCALFLDLKKIYVKTTATGVLPAIGGAPVRAETTLNPLLVHAGISLTF